MTSTNSRASNHRQNRPLAFLAFVAVLFSMAAYVAFGMLGIGRHDGAGVDLKFLHVAGMTWNAGEDPYDPSARASVAGEHAKPIYSFAYPPNIYPLASIFGIFKFENAVLLSFVVNAACLALLVLGALKLASFDNGPSVDNSIARTILVSSAVIIMPFASHVSWMGQTSLMTAAALVWAWIFKDSGHSLLLGLLIAVSAIKPQMALPSLLAIALTVQIKRWIWGVPLVVAAAIYPAWAAGGLSTLLGHWLQEVGTYKASPLNQAGFQHSTGMESIFASHGAELPGLLFVALALIATTAICAHRGLHKGEQFAALSCITATLLPMHDYDFVIMAVPIVLLGMSVNINRAGTIVLWATVASFYLPQRLLRGNVPVWVLQYRTILPLILLALFLFLASNRPRIHATSLGRTKP